MSHEITTQPLTALPYLPPECSESLKTPGETRMSTAHIDFTLLPSGAQISLAFLHTQFTHTKT